MAANQDLAWRIWDRLALRLSAWLDGPAMSSAKSGSGQPPTFSTDMDELHASQVTACPGASIVPDGPGWKCEGCGWTARIVGVPGAD